MPPRPRHERVANGKLRSHRMLRGWSQEDLANELVRHGAEVGEQNLGVSAKMVGAWERGEARPRPPYRRLLCEVFGALAAELGMYPPESLTSAPSAATLDDVDRRTFLETMLGAAVLAPHRHALAGLSLEDFLHESRRYLSAWATTPTRELVPPALGCLWLAEASGSDEASCEASLLLAWLADDLGDQARMHQHYREATEQARRSGSGRLLTYVLLSWAGDTDDGPAAVWLVERAKAVLPGDAPAALQGDVFGNEAFAYSKVGDQPRALDALARMEPAEPKWPVVFPLDDAQIVRSRGEVAVGLGIPDVAIPALCQTLEAYGSAPTKRRPRILLPLAEAYRQAGDHEQAQRLLTEAQELGGKLGLRRLRTGQI
ncbi:MAG: hypothetical protein ACRDJF_07615 [Actinomycetota bacterium]